MCRCIPAYTDIPQFQCVYTNSLSLFKDRCTLILHCHRLRVGTWAYNWPSGWRRSTFSHPCFLPHCNKLSVVKPSSQFITFLPVTQPSDVHFLSRRSCMNGWIHTDKVWAVELSAHRHADGKRRLGWFQREQDVASAEIRICRSTVVWWAFSTISVLWHTVWVGVIISPQADTVTQWSLVIEVPVKFQIFWLLKEMVTSGSMTAAVGNRKRRNWSSFSSIRCHVAFSDVAPYLSCDICG